MATSPYSPIQIIDGVYTPVSVQTPQDLQLFSHWLSSKSTAQKDARRTVYENIGVMDGFEGKSLLVKLVAGEFLQQHLKKLAAAARRIDLDMIEQDTFAAEDADTIHPDQRSQMQFMEQLRSQKDILESFAHTLGTDIFSKVCLQLNFEPAAVQALCDSFSRKGDFIKELVSTLQTPEETLGTARTMRQSYASFCSLPKARALLLSKNQGAALDTQQIRSTYHELAPLIEYIIALERPERAEIMMRFEQYILSGYAQMDVDGKIPAKITQMHKESIVHWQHTLKEFKANPASVSSSQIIQALNERMGHIFYQVQVQGAKGAAKKVKYDGVRSKEDYQAVAVHTFHEAQTQFTSQQRKGTPDGVCISSDGKRLILGFATSNNTLETQGDQWQRHLCAIKNALENKKHIPGFEKVQSIECTVLYPSWISAAGAQGAQAGSAILDYFENQDIIERMAPHVRESLNILPFLNILLLGNQIIDFEDLHKFRVNIVGSSGDLWNDSIRAPSSFDTLSEHAAHVLASCFIQAFQVLKDGQFKPFSLEGVEQSTSEREKFENHIGRAPRLLLAFIGKHQQEIREQWSAKTHAQYIKLMDTMIDVLQMTAMDNEIQEPKNRFQMANKPKRGVYLEGLALAKEEFEDLHRRALKKESDTSSPHSSTQGTLSETRKKATLHTPLLVQKAAQVQAEQEQSPKKKKKKTP